MVRVLQLRLATSVRPCRWFGKHPLLHSVAACTRKCVASLVSWLISSFPLYVTPLLSCYHVQHSCSRISTRTAVPSAVAWSRHYLITYIRNWSVISCIYPTHKSTIYLYYLFVLYAIFPPNFYYIVYYLFTFLNVTDSNHTLHDYLLCLLVENEQFIIESSWVMVQSSYILLLWQILASRCHTSKKLGCGL